MAVLRRVRLLPGGDGWIAGIYLFLAVISLIVVYSSVGSLALIHGGSPHAYFFRHLFYVLLGGGVMLLVARVPYALYYRLAIPLLIFAIAGLVYTLFFGVEINEARRWIRIPVLGVTFQTSAFAQVALLLYLATRLALRYPELRDRNMTFKQVFLEFFFPAGLVVLLILPANLSTALITAVMAGSVMFVGLIPFRFLLAGAGLFLLSGSLFAGVLWIAGGHVRVETWISRITSFAGGEMPYQTMQALRAIVRGGLFGEGPAGGVVKFFLPHAYSDYVFAVIVEEWGAWMGLMVLLAYGFLWFRAFRLFLKVPGRLSAYLSLGTGIAIPLQALIHAGVVLGIFPSTGIPLPVVSMGGSAQLMMGVLFGILLSVSREIRERPPGGLSDSSSPGEEGESEFSSPLNGGPSSPTFQRKKKAENKRVPEAEEIRIF